LHYEDALRLLRAETLGEDSVLVAARMGNPVEPARLDRLSTALRAIFERLQGEKTLDRELALSLHCLVTMLPQEVESWARATRKPTPEPLRDALIRLEMAVESVLLDSWCRDAIDES
jgi:hypothetical protein